MLRAQQIPGTTQPPAADVKMPSSPDRLVAMYKNSLKTVSEFLDLQGEQREQRKRHESLSYVIKDLDRRERELGERLEGILDDTSRKRLERQLDIVRAQKHKGLKALEHLG